ncbi:helix-turn-helix transcriptional regulator [Bradyrhizobium sp. LTSP885]|uniref:helix-turn-helix domain-containing protein n=1 Tax=Bradyrhizobium sp. LTSP885 TaxID=1619232 RepID=UPI000A46F20C|nr:helix-turn-helix transcriptional regulator [Bradyrhizobium sp. LTSP885]
MAASDQQWPTGPSQVAEDGDTVFARPSFYAEFAPAEDHGSFVDSIYVLKDRGQLTESRLAFASPFRELAFIFPESASGSGHSGKVVLNEPNGGHRKKGRTFFGWIIGIKFKPTWSDPLHTDNPAIVACQNSLARVTKGRPSCLDVLDHLDQALLALSQQTRHGSVVSDDRFETSHDRVGNLANHVGGTVRTLHRRMTASTGFPPKRFLAMQRFRRSVYEIATGGVGLSVIASDLGFSDQAHLTREFQRHAGVSPGAFKRAWQGRHARAVRFLQDTGRFARLRIAVWPIETKTNAG